MFTIRRFFVAMTAVCIAIIGIVALARAASVGAGTIRYIGAALSIAVALYGLVGTVRLNYRHLFAFTFFLFFVWLYLIANMVYQLVKLDPVDAIEDILLAGITFVCLIVSASLTHAVKDLAQHDKALASHPVAGVPAGMAVV